MSHRRSVSFAAIGLTALLLACAVGIAAAAAPATQPALPKADKVRALDDAKLYGLYQSLVPDPTVVENQTIVGDDPEGASKREIWAELDKRADARLKLLLAGVGWGGGEDSSGGDLDPVKQVEFAKRWSVWKQYVRVVPAGK